MLFGCRLPGGAADRGTGKLFHFSAAEGYVTGLLTVEVTFDNPRMSRVAVPKSSTVKQAVDAVASVLTSQEVKSSFRGTSLIELVRQN